MLIQKMAVTALSTSLLLGGAGITPAAQRRTATEQKAQALQLPITGTFAGGTFAGTVSIQRFVVREGQPVAIGFVRGTATSSAGASLGTVFAGSIAFPVKVEPAGPLTSATAAETAVLAQAVCQVAHIELGAVNLNVLGLLVVTQPVSLDISGDTAGPLGNLVCTLLDLLNNVVGLVGVLNAILGLLTGLLGGIGGLLP
jgi:hypothetical protein